MPSKVFGPTDSVADTLTQVGTTFQMPPNKRGTSDWIISQLLVAKGNIVNAKQCSGHILVETSIRSYHFAYGGGVGGATNGHTSPAEKIECCIPVPPNSNLKVYVLDGEVAKDVTVSVQFADQNFGYVAGRLANPNTFRTLAGGGASANGDTVADTAESFTASAKLLRATMQPELNGTIFQIRYAGAGIVDAKANSAKLIVYVPQENGPYEYAVGNGPSGATLGGPSAADVITIPEGIPVKQQSNIDAQITTAEVQKSPCISFSYW